MHAGDIIRTLRFIIKRDDIQKDNISGIAVGDVGPAMLHAAVFEELIKKVALVNSPASYRCIVLNRLYDYDFSILIPGILKHYDLPDLAAALAPRPLLLVNMANNTSLPAPKSWVIEEEEVALTAYKAKNRLENISIRLWDATHTYSDIYDGWLNH